MSAMTIIFRNQLGLVAPYFITLIYIEPAVKNKWLPGRVGVGVRGGAGGEER